MMDQLWLHSCVKDLCRGSRGPSLNLHKLSSIKKTAGYYFTAL